MAGPEKKLQRSVIRWVEKEFTEEEIIPRKFPSSRVGSNGWPDYDFLLPNATIFFIEFKAPGSGKCTVIQLEKHRRLRALGHHVYVCDDKEEGQDIILAEVMAAKRLRKKGKVIA